MRQTGLTLIELLIILTILSLLILGGTINWGYYYAQHQNGVFSDQINVLLKMARAKSYQEHLPVVVCSSNDHENCNQGQWHGELLIFVDHNRNKIYDGDDEIIKHEVTIPTSFYLTWSGFPKGDYIQFKTDKLLSNSNGTLGVYHEKYKNLVKRAFVLSQGGMIRQVNSGV
ncbi:GspH/FimT family protein [Thiotrichales bacterium 19S11-10]|nr:GspH/FimT family protein [Thiotrichales bacterium 19S11-10]